MARHDARNWHDCTKMIGLLFLVASTLQETSGQRVKVEPEVLSYPGQTVNLRCAFADATGIQLTMVTWIYESKDGERSNIAIFHPSFDPNYPESPVKGRVSFTPSPPNLASPSIQISNVRMTDEGKYICEYAIYPSGNEQGITSLVMLETSGQRVKVEPEVLSYPGQTVNLCCAFADATGIQLTMVTWIYESKDGERSNIAIFHPSFDPNYPESPVKGRVSFTPSPPNLASPSIQISNVRMTDEGKYICEYAIYPSGNEQGITSLVMLETSGQRVKVEPEVLSYPGQTVNLRCAFADATGIQLTMVTWIYESKDGERSNIAIFHPSFDPNYPKSPVKGRVSFTPSPPNLASPSIQISNVRMTDEGKYICEYAIYPSGNEQGITSLVMLAKPQNSASVITVEAGTEPVVVARCESLDGRPAAQISWVTTANGNGTTVSKAGTDNTVTMSSEYRMVPTAADNRKDISCVVTHRTQVKPETFPMKLVVWYAPQVTIVGYDNNWYVGRTNVVLTCQTTGNPTPVSLMWKTMKGEMPDTVQVKYNQLKVLQVDDAVNTTFVCEVRNRIGIGRDQVTTMVRA